MTRSEIVARRAELESACGKVSDSTFEVVLQIAELFQNPAARTILKAIMPRTSEISFEEFLAVLAEAEKAVC